MKLKSFGCSFIYGTDLADNNKEGTHPRPSRLTWPALIAQQLGMFYQCHAMPGTGNLSILDQILRQIECDSVESFYVIGWTYIDRFDFDSNTQPDRREKWSTLRPGHKGKLEEFYYKNLHSETIDKLRSLSYVDTAINALKQKNIPFFMIYQDELLLDQRWHCPPSVINLQTKVESYLHNFDGKPFITWSRDCGYKISETAHPLEEAHRAAADLMLPLVKQSLNL